MLLELVDERVPFSGDLVALGAELSQLLTNPLGLLVVGSAVLASLLDGLFNLLLLPTVIKRKPSSIHPSDRLKMRVFVYTFAARGHTCMHTPSAHAQDRL